MAAARCNAQCSRAMARLMSALVRDLQYLGLPGWLLWSILGLATAALIGLAVYVRNVHLRPLRRRTRRLKPIPPRVERRTHPRVSDWEDKRRDDRRIT